MGKLKRQLQFNTSFDEVPSTLKDKPFYGLNLDEYQENFRDAIWSPETIAVFCDAKAGTGKTTIALGTANLLVQYGFYDGIVYIVFPTNEMKQGYLPGTQEEKTAPYIQPLIDACISCGLEPSIVIKSDDNIQAQKEGRSYIEYMAETYMRGINLDHKVIILDEASNAYGDVLRKVLTRIHDNSKAIVIGSHVQCDLLKHSERSGFVPYINAFKEANDPRVKVCELKKNYRGWFSTFCDEVVFDWERN